MSPASTSPSECDNLTGGNKGPDGTGPRVGSPWALGRQGLGSTPIAKHRPSWAPSGGQASPSRPLGGEWTRLCHRSHRTEALLKTARACGRQNEALRGFSACAWEQRRCR